MFDLIVLVVFVIVPWVIGFRSGRYWTAVIPGALCFAIVAMYVTNPPESTGDEIDVQPLVFLVSSVLGVLVCLAGAALRRRLSKPL
jgi:peptidoglycan/LPS O-acetylase OafA/YrhL